MDLNTVRELVQVLEGSTLSVLEITEGTEKIRLEKGPCAPPADGGSRPRAGVFRSRARRSGTGSSCCPRFSAGSSRCRW